MKKKYVYFFGPGGAEGRADMKALLGGKGANIAEMTGNERFAYDAYRRFISMFSGVVLGIKKKKKKTENGSEVEINQFEEIMDEVKKKYNAELDTDLNVEALKLLVEKYKAVVKKETGKDFPEEPKEQLMMAVNAVFESWNNQRAIIYRKDYSIPDNWGTAVNVQTMVFGNMGDTSGTGVAFTRNPATGEKKFYGEFLMNAQGEDVVAG